jgi:hypothetical protein
VQSFQSSSVAPKAGEDGTYTLTLEHGLGQTVYFADRPDRTVGALPTPGFLDSLGFQPENPPNAALVVDAGNGETDIAVITLDDPVFDESGPGITYDVTVLAGWQRSLDLGFTEQPTNLATFAPSFGAAHLFIDDCANYDIWCCDVVEGWCHLYGVIKSQPYCYAFDWQGLWGWIPCAPTYGTKSFGTFDGWAETKEYWRQKCNERVPKCYGACAQALNLVWWDVAPIEDMRYS